MRQNGKPTKCVLASLKVDFEDPSIRMTKIKPTIQSLNKDSF